MVGNNYKMDNGTWTCGKVKFYSNRIAMDDALNTNVPGLHCLGDSSGWTRGLMMASAMGVLMGRRLADML